MEQLISQLANFSGLSATVVTLLFGGACGFLLRSMFSRRSHQLSSSSYAVAQPDFSEKIIGASADQIVTLLGLSQEQLSEN
jgi:hypothetical protein